MMHEALHDSSHSTLRERFLMKPYYQDEAFTVYHGDCREIMPQLDASTVDITIADPPYNLDLPYGGARGVDRLEEFSYARWTQSWFTVAPQPLVTFTGTKNLAMWCQMCEPTWVGAWHKPNAAGGQPLNGFAAWEPILFYGRPSVPVRHDSWSVPLTAQQMGSDRNTPRPGKIRTNGIANTGKVQRGRHPCPKPLPLMWRMVNETTTVGQTVLDPFAGSGTTLRACKDLGRKGIAIETEEAYCEMIVEYLAQDVLTVWEVENA